MKKHNSLFDPEMYLQFLGIVNKHFKACFKPLRSLNRKFLKLDEGRKL